MASLKPPSTKAKSRSTSPRPPPLDIPRSPPTSPTPSTSTTHISSANTDRMDSAHPFANSTAKLEIIPMSGIDVEEESRLYDEIYGTWDGDENVQPPSPPFSPGPGSIFSKDIYLADNTGNDSLAFARDVRISGWSQVGELNPKKSPGLGNMNSGAYVVYDCVITTKEGTTMHILRRYSDFEKLEHRLRRTLPTTLHPSIPQLPPKAPLARFRPAFLDRRRRLLQFWLASVLLHPEIGASEAVRGWVVG